MKTKEFIKRIEELGFEVWISGGIAYVLKDGRYEVARIKTKRACAIDFFYLLNETLDKEISEKLFDIIVEYAKTPIEDREEEKKIYLRHRYFRFNTGSSKYLGIDLVKDKPDLCSKITCRWMKNQFTEKEIEEIKEKYNTDLKDFEPEEVKE